MKMTNEEIFMQHMQMFDEYVEALGRSRNLLDIGSMSDQAQEIVLSMLQNDFQNLI
jgi:hypothetical protein